MIGPLQPKQTKASHTYSYPHATSPPPILSSFFFTMATTGVVYKDLLPIPHETEPEKVETATTVRDTPTVSHALAMEKPEQKGAAQMEHGQEVVNLGWNEPKEAVASPLVGGLKNDDLWVLVRRFNKVSIYPTACGLW
jgi:hypothetical protein